MKKLSNLKIKFIIALLVVAMACFMIAVLTVPENNQLVKADKVVISGQVFNDEYNINSEVDFPSEIQVEYNGKTVTADSGVMTYPDGSVVYAGAVKLDKLGDYVVRYFFQDDNGNKCVAEKTFSVTNKLYSVSSSNGSVIAVSAESQKDKAFEGNDTDVTFSKEDGLIVRLAEGDSFDFTTSLDLADVGEDGLCDIITLDYRNVNFVPNPQATEVNAWNQLMVKSKIADYVIIRLSDSYDLGNYVELYCRLTSPSNDSVDINEKDEDGKYVAQKANYYPSFSACAVGQMRTALTPEIVKEYATYYNISLDGQKYGLYYNNEKGGRSFSNIPMTGAHTPFTWKYDYKTNKIYIQQGEKVEIVSALSSSEIYKTETFEGFSSGKVKLSIYMSSYESGEQGRIDIHSVGSYSGEELVDNFGKLGFVDNVAAPVVKLPFNVTDERGIYVPFGAEYTLPTPEIVSNETVVSTAVYAYANYGMDNQIDVPIKGGKIKIDKDRRYTILYTVKNAAGCEGYQTLTINPVKVDAAISLQTDFSALTEIMAGETVQLPEYNLTTINDSKALDLEIYAVHDKETLKVDKNTRTFIPSFTGEYKIVYKCFDNVFNVDYEYTLNCSASNKVSFIGEVALPRYFIKNANYTLNPVPAYTFNADEPTPLEVTAFISYDNGVSFTKIDDYKCAKIEGEGSAIIKYVCEDNGNSAEVISNPVPIVDVGYGQKKALRLKDYFLHENFNVKSYEESGKNDMQYDSLVKTGNNTLKFINAIDFTSLNMTFKIPANLSNYQRVNIILSDYYDASKTYVISYIEKENICYASIDGDAAVASGYNFADNSVTKKLNYNVLSGKLTVNDLVFTGVDLSSRFTSSLCYIEIELVDITGDASIIIDSIGMQNFRKRTVDDGVGPTISIKDFSGEYVIGSVITISAPCVTDVLSTIVDKDVSIKVLKDGKPISSLDGILLNGKSDAMRDYQIKLESYGQYTVDIVAKDGAGKSTPRKFFVAVVDVTAPTIDLETSQIVSIKKGETLSLKYSVSDDISSEEQINVTVFMRDVKANCFYTPNTNKIRFNNAGEFEVYIYAKDARGNISQKVINVTVKG